MLFGSRHLSLPGTFPHLITCLRDDLMPRCVDGAHPTQRVGLAVLDRTLRTEGHCGTGYFVGWSRAQRGPPIWLVHDRTPRVFLQDRAESWQSQPCLKIS